MEPTVGEPFAAHPDVHVIPTYWPLSEDSVLTINVFVLHAAEPVLVDTGAGAVSDEEASTPLPWSCRWTACAGSG